MKISLETCLFGDMEISNTMDKNMRRLFRETTFHFPLKKFKILLMQVNIRFLKNHINLDNAL
jgi:hypothetical protein